ncbi:MAG TPA: 4-phosphoerythronate dehydrogenase [Bacteroidales bacterium]|nr:4-phosphoerythronate dehydrogenase [Bacteroidales bacterium]
MKIVIDENIPFIRGAFERWADVVYAPGRSIDARMVADADALIVRTRTRCDAALLKGSSVRIVASATIGFDHIDTLWLEQNGIKWANAPGCNSGSVMQYITSLLFFLAEKHSFDPCSVTLGIVGVGNVGSKVARAAGAIGRRVLLNDPPLQRQKEGSEDFRIEAGRGGIQNHTSGFHAEADSARTRNHTSDLYKEASRGKTVNHTPDFRIEAGRGGTEFHPLRTLLTDCDIITFHVPLNREGDDKTFRLIDRDILSRPGRQKIIINSSRGEVVDNLALREALKSGRVRGAALDVWEGEPAADPQLIDLADIATPHIAGYSVDGKANATISSVGAVAAELGLPMHDWAPAELPQPAMPLIDLTGKGGATAVEIVAHAVKHTYNVKEDDLLFRNNRENFEYLRDNYRIRREFSSYRVKTNDPEAERILGKLGFQIIK